MSGAPVTTVLPAAHYLLNDLPVRCLPMRALQKLLQSSDKGAESAAIESRVCISASRKRADENTSSVDQYAFLFISNLWRAAALATYALGPRMLRTAMIVASRPALTAFVNASHASQRPSRRRGMRSVSAH